MMNYRTSNQIRKSGAGTLLLGLWAAALLGASTVARADYESDWLNKMSSIMPKSYVCRFAPKPLKIDGKFDDPAWSSAPWTEDFVDIEGNAKPAPRFRTRAKLLWDNDYLYIGAELTEPHVWATLTNHDSVIFQDPDFEVFIDPKGETAPYYEFEMNALNTTWDLMLPKPYIDNGKPHNEWESGAITAVQVHGKLNHPAGKDKGWTVEIAFPWKVLSAHARHAGPPAEGEQWRINFSRVEWQITATNGAYQKVRGRPEDNWVWSPQGVVDMHRPEMWGVVQFTTKPPKQKVSVTPVPDIGVRNEAIELYYSQKDFWTEHHRWATNTAQLAWAGNRMTGLPRLRELTPTADGYVYSVTAKENEVEHTWRIRQDRLLKLDEPMPVDSEVFVAQAQEKYGDLGRRAAYFLVDNMPAEDRPSLDLDFLAENLRLAMEARQKFSWAKAVPERIYFNDVLPYAALDEPRDPWRQYFFDLGSEIVKNCTNATEAAQALNREIFNRVKVHYNTARKRNNQSPAESMEQGRATCTGLAIILVDACRAVGVPARIAGVPKWVDKEGNHTWVEIWDGDWNFTGADEYDAKGLNRAWFNRDAARTAHSTNAINQVYAASWRRTGDYFPLAWDLDSHAVSGVNVSARYAGLESDTNTTAGLVHVRLREKNEGERLPSTVELRTASGGLVGQDHTRAGTADMNDMPEFKIPDGAANVIFRFVRNNEAREMAMPCANCIKAHTLDFAWDDLTPVAPTILAAEDWLGRSEAERGAPPGTDLSRAEAPHLAALAWADLEKRQAAAAEAELSAKNIVIGDKSMKWMEKDFGDAADGSHSLWITLHGGGQGTEAENDANWHGYFGRYEFPPGSINVAPRAPANTWDMWHVKWVDGLLDRLIADFVIQRGVDPRRVYLIGYSAGGDGVYQLAPRLADRFAAAGMCAGHPNQVTPEGLRNLPFFLYMGGADSAYNRNVVVREFSAKMDALQAADPTGYPHRLTVYPGLPHAMQGREAEMIPRMTPLRRTAWPKRVVWKQNENVQHTRFYWLERDADAVKPGEIYAAHVDGQTINLETPATGKVTLRLSDTLLDLDQPIKVLAGGKTVYEGKVPRTFASIVKSLNECEDPDLAATAILPVSW